MPYSETVNFWMTLATIGMVVVLCVGTGFLFWLMFWHLDN